MTKLEALTLLITFIRPGIEEKGASTIQEILLLGQNVDHDTELVASLAELSEKYGNYLKNAENNNGVYSDIMASWVKSAYGKCFRRSIELLNNSDEWRLKL